MLETNFKQSLEKLLSGLSLIPDEFFIPTEHGDYEVIWFLNRQKPSVSPSYDFDEERFGITKNGEIIWGFDSGCSCPSPWRDAGDIYEKKDWKEFILMPEDIGMDEGWQKDALEEISDYLLLASKKPKASEVIKAKNSEIRRFLMKRFGFSKLSKELSFVEINRDNFGILYEVEIAMLKERYVKVKDSSTDREYLLYVDSRCKTAKGAIAWTFGLEENEYAPLIET